MGKEYRFWQTERRVFADKLADEERLAGDSKGGENLGADLDNQIKQVCFLPPQRRTNPLQNAEQPTFQCTCSRFSHTF